MEKKYISVTFVKNKVASVIADVASFGDTLEVPEEFMQSYFGEEWEEWEIEYWDEVTDEWSILKCRKVNPEFDRQLNEAPMFHMVSD